MTDPIRFGVLPVGRAEHALATIKARRRRPPELPDAETVIEDVLAWLRLTRRPPLEETG
jgi:hypothetical protein